MKDVEFLRLTLGSKRCMRVGVYAHEKGPILQHCKRKNLHAVCSDFSVILHPSTDYTHKGYMYRGDEVPSANAMEFLYMGSSSDVANAAMDAERKGDVSNLGALLGYPKCCVTFFAYHHKTVEKSDFDLTSLSIGNTSKGPWQMNITQRANDICLLSHFPCSLLCSESFAQAEEAYDLFEIAHPAVARVWQDMLRLPSPTTTFI